jgi:hypothetical protein
MQQQKRVLYLYGLRFLILALFVMVVSGQNSPILAEETENIEELVEVLQIIMFDEPTKAPEFSLTSMDGTTKTLDDFKGQVIFLNFWTTW